MNAAEQTIPAELLLPAPRTLMRVKSPPGKSSLVAKIFLLGVAAGLLGLLVFSIAEPIGLVLGRDDQGLITRKYLVQSRRANFEHLGYLWQGRAETGEVGRDVYERVQIGQPIPLRVGSIGGWEFVRLDDFYQHYARERIPIWLIDLMPIAATVIILLVARRTRRLLSQGKPVVALVTHREIRRQKQNTYHLTVVYDTGSSKPQEKTIAVPQSFYERTLNDPKVIAVYDPARPKSAIVYGTNLWQCAPQHRG